MTAVSWNFGVAVNWVWSWDVERSMERVSEVKIWWFAWAIHGFAVNQMLIGFPFVFNSTVCQPFPSLASNFKVYRNYYRLYKTTKQTIRVILKQTRQGKQPFRRLRRFINCKLISVIKTDIKGFHSRFIFLVFGEGDTQQVCHGAFTLRFGGDSRCPLSLNVSAHFPAHRASSREREDALDFVL